MIEYVVCRLKKLNWNVYLYGMTAATEEEEEEARSLLDRVGMGEARVLGDGVRLVVKGSRVGLDGTVFLSLILRVPVVKMDWLRKWSERNVWLRECPLEDDYAAIPVHNNDAGDDVDLDLFETRTTCTINGTKTAVEKEFGSYDFLWPWGDAADEDVHFLRALGLLKLHVVDISAVESRQRICSEVKNPVVIMKRENDELPVHIPRNVALYCTMLDLMVRVLQHTVAVETLYPVALCGSQLIISWIL